jgi:hypothetical protein
VNHASAIRGWDVVHCFRTWRHCVAHKIGECTAARNMAARGLPFRDSKDVINRVRAGRMAPILDG